MPWGFISAQCKTQEIRGAAWHLLHPASQVPPVRLGPDQCRRQAPSIWRAAAGLPGKQPRREGSSSPHDRSTTGRTLHSPRQGHPAQHCPHTTAAAKARPILFKLRM